MGLTFIRHKSTLTGVIDRLERDGLVTRVASLEDRRQTPILLTEQGRRALKQVPQKSFPTVARATAEMSDDEKLELVKSLRRLGHALGITRS